MRHVILSLEAAQFVLRMSHLVINSADRSRVLRKQCLQLGDLQDCHRFALLHSSAIVDAQGADVARLLGVDVDFLERHQLRGNRELPRDRPHGYRRHPDRRKRRRRRLRVAAANLAPGTSHRHQQGCRQHRSRHTLIEFLQFHLHFCASACSRIFAASRSTEKLPSMHISMKACSSRNASVARAGSLFAISSGID